MADERRAESDQESELVSAAASGDAAAFEQIVRDHAGLVLGLGLRLLRNRAEAEDLVQDVFLRVHRGLPAFRQEASLRTWITQVTVNAARNRHRSASRQRLHLTRSIDDDADGTGGMAATLADGSAGPQRLTLSTEVRVRVEEALSTLPVAFREVIVLREIEGLAYEEIGTALGIGLGTVKSRLARARTRLQEQLRDLVEPMAKEGR